MWFSIIISLLVIGLFVMLFANDAYTAATLDHLKLDKSCGRGYFPVNFMHPHYIKKYFLYLGISCILALHGFVHLLHWYYYVLTALAIILLYIPMYDGFYYKRRNKLRPLSYKGFWRGVDSNPANRFMRQLNEPTTRIMLFVFALFCIIIILTFEPCR